MPGQRATHCGGCRTEGMVNVRSKKCVACGVAKQQLLRDAWGAGDSLPWVQGRGDGERENPGSAWYADSKAA